MNSNLFASWFDFAWENPLYLYLIPLPLILILMRNVARRKTSARIVLSFEKPMGQHPFVQMIRFIPDAVIALCLLCVILTLADPYKPIYHQRTQEEGIEISLAIDLSSSMENKDVFPSRLVVAKQTAKAFILGRKADEIALIAFGGAPYLASPLSPDTAFIVHALANLEPKLIPEEGTALGDALGMSINQIREEANPKKIAILISDGNNTAGNLDPMTSSALAKTFGITVYTIAVGSLQPSLDPVDESTLRMIAEKTNGKFYRATDKQTLGKIFQEIDQLEKSRTLIIRDEEHKSYSYIFIYLAYALFLLYLFLKITPVSNILED